VNESWENTNFAYKRLVMNLWGGGGEFNDLEGGIEDNGKEEHQIYEISGSHGGKYEDDSLLGYSNI
jgi:hypothetical protein